VGTDGHPLHLDLFGLAPIDTPQRRHRIWLMRLLIAVITIFVSIGVGVWGAIGWAVTSATGVLSYEERWEFTAAMVVGICGGLLGSWLLWHAVRKVPSGPRRTNQ
jgi:hypothetical protein